MKKGFLAFAIFLLTGFNLLAQKDSMLNTLPNGSIFTIGKGIPINDKTTKIGNFISLHYTQILKRTGKQDSVVMSTRKLGKTEALPLDSSMLFNPDPKQDFGLRVLLGLKINDSATIIQKIETVVAENPQAETILGKTGTIESVFSIVNIYNNQQEYLAELKTEKTIALETYIATNNLINSFKKEDGIYVSIISAGVGANIKNENFVKVRYTGRTINGKIFDSNIEDIPGRPAQPGPKPTLDFTVGKQEMIPGFDDAMKYFSKGAKGRFVLPYDKAYGEQGNQGIAPYETLIFDVEIIDVLASRPIPPPPPPSAEGKPSLTAEALNTAKVKKIKDAVKKIKGLKVNLDDEIPVFSGKISKLDSLKVLQLLTTIKTNVNLSGLKIAN